MSKLVLRLPDGSTREYSLARERVTIGRRADNDICLPFPAVSGEHAAVVTILDDSFLEDLRSTNGTLVNGRPISKHFLRDRDEIDIGRHTLIYLTGETALMAPDAVGVSSPPVTVTENGGAMIGNHEATLVTPLRPRAIPRSERDAGALPPLAADATSSNAAPRILGQGVARPPAIDADARHDTPVNPPMLEVLDGPAAGTTVAVAREELVFGRVGEQLAAVRRSDEGFRLVPLEGDTPPRLNGSPVPDSGALIALGDEIEIAGTRLLWRPAV